MEQIYLTRRNLLSLLSKLDRVMKGEESTCCIIKGDNTHPKYPQSMEMCSIIAVEDGDYYADRTPGGVYPGDKFQETRNSVVLRDFVQYCESNPASRFWQALRNWSGYDFVLLSKGKILDALKVSDLADTFYWEGKDK